MHLTSVSLQFPMLIIRYVAEMGPLIPLEPLIYGRTASARDVIEEYDT
jgi:hypothetical protein